MDMIIGLRPHDGKFGVVRDKDGNVKVGGDPKLLEPGIVMFLTPAEREGLGLWAGPLARDAQGIKRLTKNGETFTAEDALVAVGEIWFDGCGYRVVQRVDVPRGGTFTVKKEV